MEKIFDFGKIDFNNIGESVNKVTVDVKLIFNDNNKPIFSCCGNIWNSRKKDIICGGQCLDIISEYIKSDLFKEIYRLWKLYHLNNMKAGTPEQEKEIDKWLSNGNKYNYNNVCAYLKSIDMYEVEHEDKLYKYGHSWLYSPIPKCDYIIIKNLLDIKEDK